MSRTEPHNELISPHNLIRKYRNGTLELKYHPHEQDCLNTTIYPVCCKHLISIRCSKYQYNFKDHIERMPETILYETESMINSLQIGLLKKSTPTPHTDCILCVTHLRMNINSNNTNYYKHTANLDVGIIISLKKDKNLRDILVKACIEIQESKNDTEHNLNIREAEIEIDRNYCVSCHPLSSGRAILSKSALTKIGYRSVQNCKQMHDKYAIYCHICQEPNHTTS